MMRQQAGTSLIEILVTILIVSFGLLGVAGVVGNGLKNNHSSYGRTQASILAADIIDRMRANRVAAEVAGSPYTLANCAAAPATPVTVAETDVKQWCDTLAAVFPSGTGTGSITVGATPTFKVTVVVQWDDSRAAGGSSNQQFTVETRL